MKHPEIQAADSVAAPATATASIDAVTPTDTVPAGDPVIDTTTTPSESVLKRAEDVVIHAVDAVEHAVESGIKKVEEIFHHDAPAVDGEVNKIEGDVIGEINKIEGDVTGTSAGAPTDASNSQSESAG